MSFIRNLDVETKALSFNADKNKVSVIGGRDIALSISNFKNAIIKGQLSSYGGGNIRLILGAIIENRFTNSLETIYAASSNSLPLERESSFTDYFDRNQRYPIRYTTTTSKKTNAYKTDPRDLSYYFLEFQANLNPTIILGKCINGVDTVLSRRSGVRAIKGNSITVDDYGTITFSCYQIGPNAVKLSARIGTEYLTLPYTTLHATDSNNKLANAESSGYIGFIGRGLSFDNLVIASRSENSPFDSCSGGGKVYSWQSLDPTLPGGSAFEDPNPPQPGIRTIISNINGVVLSYNNSGTEKDLLRVNNLPIIYRNAKVNRFSLYRSGWIPLCAASNQNITQSSLGTGTGQISNAIILKRTTNNFITFWRMNQIGINRDGITPNSWVQQSTDGWYAPDSDTLYNIETILNFDLNNDSIIGKEGQPPPTPGTNVISTVGNVVLSYDIEGTDKNLLKVNGDLVKNGNGNFIDYFDYLNTSYETVAAGNINGQNMLVFRTPNDGKPFVKNLIQALPGDDKLTNNPSQIRIFQSPLTTIPIRFSVPVTGVTQNSFSFYSGGRGWAVRNFTVSGSGQNYVLTIPSSEVNRPGLWEVRIYSTNIKGVINGKQVSMKQPSRLYWAINRMDSISPPAGVDNDPPLTSLVVWNMSSEWEKSETSIVYRLNTNNYYQAENDFNIDFNNDNIIGHPNATPPEPEEPEPVNIIEDTGNVVLSYDSNNNLQANNIPIKFNTRPLNKNNRVWEFLAADNISGVNSLLLRSKDNGASFVLRFDDNWNNTAGDSYALPGTDKFFDTETLFDIDVNEDDIVGRPRPPVTLPTQVGSNLVFSYDRTGEEQNLLKINNSLIKDKNNNNINFIKFPIEWEILAAGRHENTHVIVLKYKLNGFLFLMKFDENWKHMSGSSSWYAPLSPTYNAIETSFGLDFNQDGAVGARPTTNLPPTDTNVTNIENVGSVTLAYNSQDILTANGNSIKYNNTPIKRTNKDWNFVAAERINNVNTLVCESKQNKYLNFLRFDDNWNSIGGEGWYAPNSADYLAAELLFQSDFDKDGNTGPRLTLNTSFDEATVEAVINQNFALSVDLNTNINSGAIFKHEWEYDIGNGWVDWTLGQQDTYKLSTINISFLSTYNTLKVRCKTTVVFFKDSLALSVFGGNLEIVSKTFTATKKQETNYLAIRSANPITFTYNRNTEFNLDDLPKYVQDQISIIMGGDLGTDYITGINNAWTPLCSVLEGNRCSTYLRAVQDGTYGTRVLKSGLTYTIYPRIISFVPFIIDFENLS